MPQDSPPAVAVVTPARRNQATIGAPQTLAGTGLHTGKPATLTIYPAEPGHGVVFVRTDLPGTPRIPADLAHAVERDRRTVLATGDAEVHTTEHFLSACVGLRIDNVRAELDGPELPAADGSARNFMALLQAASRHEQSAPKPHWRVLAPLNAQHGDTHIVALPPPGETGYAIAYTLDYPHPLLRGHVAVACDSPEAYAAEIAPARTFVMEEEARALQAMGFGLGATTQNTLVMGAEGPLENTLRFPDECVRHKVLDVIGDLALLGVDLDAQIVAIKSGHHLNRALARKLQAAVDALPRGDAVADLPAAVCDAASAAMDIEALLGILPHRFPFLMLDRVLELEPGRRAVAIKNVTINEPFFLGHFPQKRIMPGVLQLEAMAQLGGLVISGEHADGTNLGIILGIDGVRFRRAVVPGDRLLIEADVTRIRSQGGRVRCRGSVDGQPACEATFLFSVQGI